MRLERATPSDLDESLGWGMRGLEAPMVRRSRLRGLLRDALKWWSCQGENLSES